MDSDSIRLSFMAGVKYRGKIYFSALWMNGLFSYDTETGETVFLSAFAQEKVHDYLHVKAFLHGNEMWLIPVHADHIACVNLDTLEIQYFEIPGRERFATSPAYLDGIIDDGVLYILPFDAPSVLKVDLETHDISVVYQAEELLICWGRGGFIYENKLHILTTDGEIGIRIDLKTGEHERLYERLGSHDAYLYSFYSNGEVWMPPYGAGSIKKYSVTTCEEQTFPLPDPQDAFHRGEDIGDYIVMYPVTRSRKILFFEKKTGAISINDRVFVDEDEPMKAWFEVNKIECDAGYWASSTNGVILEFLPDASTIVHHATMPKSVFRCSLSNIYKNTGLIYTMYDKCAVTESEFSVQLNDYLWFIANKIDV